MTPEVIQKLVDLFRRYPGLLVETLCALDKPPTCEGSEGPCDRTDVRLVPPRTAYLASEEDPHPNHASWLCPDCEAAYHEFWNDMWAEYYRNRL